MALGLTNGDSCKDDEVENPISVTVDTFAPWRGWGRIALGGGAAK